MHTRTLVDAEQHVYTCACDCAGVCRALALCLPVRPTMRMISSHIDMEQMRRSQFVHVIVRCMELWPCVCIRVLQQIEPY